MSKYPSSGRRLNSITFYLKIATWWPQNFLLNRFHLYTRQNELFKNTVKFKAHLVINLERWSQNDEMYQTLVYKDSQFQESGYGFSL